MVLFLPVAITHGLFIYHSRVAKDHRIRPSIFAGGAEDANSRSFIETIPQLGSLIPSLFFLYGDPSLKRSA
jgi:hypothetical protein